MGKKQTTYSGRSVPFLRWPGAKRWLASVMPKIVGGVSGTYFEPFLGSGAIFFALAPQSAFLSDANPALINIFCMMQRDPMGVQRLLDQHAAAHGKEYYYKIRNRRADDQLQSAADFLYINRACFNGIYRVNKAGEFNVPIGTRNKILLDTDDFQKTSSQLRTAELHVVDFETAIGNAKEGDVVFADPPYTVAHNNNGFVAYNETIFSWADQKRLKSAGIAAVNRGANVFITNAAHKEIAALYADSGFRIYEVERLSKISGRLDGRGKYAEFLISSKEIDKEVLAPLSGKKVDVESLETDPAPPPTGMSGIQPEPQLV